MEFSSISHLNRSTYEERKANLNYLRGLYFLFALHLIIAWLWTNLCYSWQGLSDFVVQYWPIALVLGIIALLVHLVCLLVAASRNNPINWALYFVFTITFAYAAAWLCLVDSSQLVYYCLSLITAIGIGFCMYSLYPKVP